MRRRALPPLAAARRQRQLELGERIAEARAGGTRWPDLVARFGLADEFQAKRLTVQFLMHLAEPPETTQDGAVEAQTGPAR